MHPFQLDETIDDTTDLPGTDTVKVFVVNEREDTRRPEFGEGYNFVFAGTAADQPQQILPQSPKRHRAEISIINTVGNAFILIGSESKVSNGQGYKLLAASGQNVSLKIESQSAVWAISDKANPCTVNVWDERYQ
jgi:hypothetical protein